MSWKAHQISFLNCLASSNRLFSVCNGTEVEVSFKTEKLLPLRMQFDLQIVVIRFVRIFEKPFLAVSIKVIGCVISRFPSHSLGLGIRVITAFFHSAGISVSDRQRLYNSSKCCFNRELAFFINMFWMPEGPGALCDDDSLMIFSNSSYDIGFITEIKTLFEMCDLGSYWFFHSSDGQDFIIHFLVQLWKCCLTASSTSGGLSINSLFWDTLSIIIELCDFSKMLAIMWLRFVVKYAWFFWIAIFMLFAWYSLNSIFYLFYKFVLIFLSIGKIVFRLIVLILWDLILGTSKLIFDKILLIRSGLMFCETLQWWMRLPISRQAFWVLDNIVKWFFSLVRVLVFRCELAEDSMASLINFYHSFKDVL